MKKLILLTLALLLLALPALAEEDASITVIGTAAITLKADHAQVTIECSTRAESVTAASEETRFKTAAVIDALKTAGVDALDMTTNNYSVYSYNDYSDNNDGKLMFTVSNSLNVIIRDVKNISKLLDIALDAGATQIYNIQFQSTEAALAADEALVKAIAEGARKAQLMAGACGHTLGSLVSLTEQSNTSIYTVEVYDMAKRNSSDNVILPEDLTITATVVMTYRAKP